MTIEDKRQAICDLYLKGYLKENEYCKLKNLEKKALSDENISKYLVETLYSLLKNKNDL